MHTPKRSHLRMVWAHYLDLLLSGVFPAALDLPHAVTNPNSSNIGWTSG